MPCELITPYHGQKADFGRSRPAREALRWHWDVCVIENMGAKAVESGKNRLLNLWAVETSSSRSRQRDAEDENDDGSGNDDGMGPPSASAGPASRGVGGDGKRSRLPVVQGEAEEDNLPYLSYGGGSSAPSFAESWRRYGGATKRQRTAAWLDSIPPHSPAFEGP